MAFKAFRHRGDINMIDFLNTLVFSMDGVYGVRVIHIILLALTIPFIPSTIREIKELFIEEK